MSDSEHNDHLAPIEERLRSSRAELTPMELDGVKRRAMSARTRQMPMKTRLVTALVVLGLVGSGGTAVIAASGGSKGKGNSANSQYCPEQSPGAGKPKTPKEDGAKCGHPENGSQRGR
jgi:hypothetical protein